MGPCKLVRSDRWAGQQRERLIDKDGFRTLWRVTQKSHLDVDAETCIVCRECSRRVASSAHMVKSHCAPVQISVLETRAREETLL